MIREIIQTKDGSSSVAIPEMNVTYHSIHGARQESMHVFIHSGLIPLIVSKQWEVIHVFEMGLGTGLNTLLTAEQAMLHQQKIHYTTIELFPLQIEEANSLNYNNSSLLLQMHRCNWEEDVRLNDFYTLHKINQSLLSYHPNQTVDLIYYDAFAPNAQPELWTKNIFEKLFSMLNENGILVTYCSKGDVRRAMLEAGFRVEKLQGPPHKREMLRAKKQAS